MAYQAFYNKYRPKTFDEVVGQKAIVETLKNAIRDDKIAHAYLFCGPRGTGKTSMARLFAKSLNCHEGVGHQCNECDSCLSIINGSHPDVYEIDAASNSTVDSVRQLIENVNYQPLLSRYKIYIIDEVHNMSNAAFNALLKTLEEPPSFVIFILATTEPQKILPTILSRVQRFDFSKVTNQDLVTNMKRVLDAEGIKYEEAALNLVASLSDGGVRDSLSLLDKVVSYAGKELTVNDVNEMLGLLSLNDELQLINLISQKKIDECLKLIKEKHDKGIDIIRLHNDLIKIYKDLIVYYSTKDESLLETLSKENIHKLNVNIYEVKRNIQLLITAKREYRNTDDIFSHFQLTILSLMDELTVPSTSVVESKKEANTPVSGNLLISTPTEIKSENTQKGKIIKEVKEENDDLIKYTFDDILNLMNQAEKQTRIDIANKWGEVQNYFDDESLAFEAKALNTCKVRLVAKNIILITNGFTIEINKLNTKTAQKKIKEIINKIYNANYSVLTISEDEFKQAFAKFKVHEIPDAYEPQIDFGTKEASNTSEEFYNELIG